MKSIFFSIGAGLFLFFAPFSRASAQDLRLVVPPGPDHHQITQFPPSSQPWKLEYVFKVPPLPRASGWDYKSQEIYVWGDVDFDTYSNSISDYLINQIVPQVMIGHDTAGGDSQYNEKYFAFDRWVIQAQYYWSKLTKGERTSYDMAGDALPVEPGEVVTAVIRYDPTDGAIYASISAPGKNRTSSIVIPKPFLNEPNLFKSWREFFEKAEAKTKTYEGQAGLPNFDGGVSRQVKFSVIS